jgi:DNA-binding transcriptional regulator YhcF (GntR family)
VGGVGPILGVVMASCRTNRDGERMRIISVDPDSDVPPFEQVRSSIAEQVTSGDLAVGAKLPTVRALAAELGIAANTAAKAYRELEQAGLIETRGRAGTFVSDAGDQAAARAAEAAATYAQITQALGIPKTEALAIVQAALKA